MNGMQPSYWWATRVGCYVGHLRGDWRKRLLSLNHHVWLGAGGGRI